MPSSPDDFTRSPDGSVELTPLQLIRWIDTSPDLGYLRDAADTIQGRYDSTTGQLSFQKPSTNTVVSKENGPLRLFRYFFWPKANSIRGKSCASQEFDQSCGNTVNIMAASTLWDAISTYPLIEFALTDFLSAGSFPAAVIISLGLTAGSNIAGKESCNRTKGKRTSARAALLIFLGLSFLRTVFSGVGIDILVNRSGITTGYAEDLVQKKIDDTSLKIEELGTLNNPVLKSFDQSCKASTNFLEKLGRSDPLWDQAFRKVNGSFAEQKAMQGRSVQEVINMYGAIENVPGECNKYKYQFAFDDIKSNQLRNYLKVYQSDQGVMSPYNFLKTHFPETYNTKFKEDKEGNIDIREGGELVRTSIKQFYVNLLQPSEWSSLGFSLFGMIISILLSVGSVFMLRSKSKSEDMQMSFSDQMLNEREDLLNGYSEKLESSQERRRAQQNQKQF